VSARRKRSPGVLLQELFSDIGIAAGSSIEDLALEEVLDRLSAPDARQVELRFFGGLEIDEMGCLAENGKTRTAEGAGVPFRPSG
jgi:hypothetical protein